jgi:hypothetical protein
MDEISASEVRGDASNLKGTNYHLLYALWLLLRSEAESVHFFQGNDLLAKPSPPPLPESKASLSTSAVARLANQQDVWIQLKCTVAPWTRSKLLDDNLLDNFVCNTFLSESRGHSWNVALVTTSEIRRKDVLQFLDNPSSFPDLYKKLDTIVGHMARKLADVWPGIPLSKETVKERATEVLRTIAQCEAMSQRVLEAEISEELAFRFVDRQVALTIQRQLIGALLPDTAQGPEQARSYDRSWMSSVTGHDFLRTCPLEQSVAHACDVQVTSRLPHEFSVDEYAPRTRTVCMLEEFLHSPAPIFILAGRSGTGKSWILAHWACESTSGRARLLIPGHLFTKSSSLVSLIADELRPLTSLVTDDQTLFQKAARPALSNTFGPFVVVLDDVQPSYRDPPEFARAVAALVDDAKKYGIKLILSCQTNVLRNLKPFSYLRPADIFQPEAPAALPPTDPPAPIASYVLDVFTDGELREAVSRRVDPGRVERVLLRLRAPAFALLRNPYMLDVFFTDAKHAPLEASDDLPSDRVLSLLDHRIESLLNKASTICGLEIHEVRQVLSYVTELLWKQSDAGMLRSGIRRHWRARVGCAIPGRDLIV